jgi:hypothetical protein
MPGKEVTDISFSSKPHAGEYRAADHRIIVSIGNPQEMLSTFIHEMGHAVYQVMFSIRGYRPVPERNAPSIYKTSDTGFISLANLAAHEGSHEIVDDSNYIENCSSDLGFGHPYSNNHELFASGFTAYYFHADKFLKAINNEKLPKTWRKFGKAMWAFQRDRVWKGQRQTVFTSDGKDPFSPKILPFPIFNFIGILPLNFIGQSDD